VKIFLKVKKIKNIEKIIIKYGARCRKFCSQRHFSFEHHRVRHHKGWAVQGDNLFYILMDRLHRRTLWKQNLQRKRQWQRQRHETVLALATLGDVTQIGLFLFMSPCPRWPRQVLFHVAVAGNNDSVIA
jgi:hypothetical protein